MNYGYETAANGVRVFGSKKEAVTNARRAGALYVRSEWGRIVWRNPQGGEHIGEICDARGNPLPDTFQVPIDE